MKCWECSEDVLESEIYDGYYYCINCCCEKLFHTIKTNTIDSMNMRCAKCEEDANGGRSRFDGDQSFNFCKFCDQFLSDHPNLSMKDYLGPTFDGWIANNIRMAHKLRLEGHSPWNRFDSNSKQ